MKPKNAWERLVLDVGIERAREIMQERRAKAKSVGGFANPENAKKAINKRWADHKKGLGQGAEG